ncbi:hypothetical protein LB517_27930 [Mesorhizobium sp. BR1-1-12]|uniref:hypothetical protein n=1 Tax=Mesorhizobium sp. BR1-1-12 TaxID=2876657 RepID=UPI001CD0B00C|nr:hypothetical protein [Mesorhizobium sp. BR1-1-12]MBZ9973463.1 hypothetical protein [Mesorhizobium sp. BR1-1-12]
MNVTLSIEEACRVILGNKLAASIIADQGIHWAVVAAMAQATTGDDRRALKAIRDWNAEQKRGSH